MYNLAEDRRNSAAAFERDSGQCIWCREVLGIYSEGSFPHHILTRRVDHSVSKQITLCRTRSLPDSKNSTLGCHDRAETAYQLDGVTEITRDKLLKLMERIYGTEEN